MVVISSPVRTVYVIIAVPSASIAESTAFTVPALIGNGNYNLYGNEIEQAFKVLAGKGDYSIGSTLSIILLICVLISTAVMNHFDKDKEGGSIL